MKFHRHKGVDPPRADYAGGAFQDQDVFFCFIDFPWHWVKDGKSDSWVTRGHSGVVLEVFQRHSCGCHSLLPTATKGSGLGFWVPSQKEQEGLL